MENRNPNRLLPTEVGRAAIQLIEFVNAKHRELCETPVDESWRLCHYDNTTGFLSWALKYVEQQSLTTVEIACQLAATLEALKLFQDDPVVKQWKRALLKSEFVSEKISAEILSLDELVRCLQEDDGLIVLLHLRGHKSFEQIAPMLETNERSITTRYQTAVNRISEYFGINIETRFMKGAPSGNGTT